MADHLMPIRLSHLLGHGSVGAIVRGPDSLLVVQDVRQWTDRQGAAAGREIPYVERVRAALGIEQKLREPPSAKELANGLVDGVCIPASRFPSWARCPRCGRLYRAPWRDAGPAAECIDGECSGARLEQVTWALVDASGCMADVPWAFLTHRDAATDTQRDCKRSDSLQLVEGGASGRELRCLACRASTRLRRVEQMHFGSGRRMQPWTRNDLTPARDTAAPHDQPLAEVLAINDSRTYTPHAESVLVIPPESRVRKGTAVDLLYRHSADRARIDNARTPLARKVATKGLATDYRCTVAEIEQALQDLARGYPLYGQRLTPGQLRESEFKAFLEVLPDQRDDEDLVTRQLSEAWHRLPACAITAGIREVVRVDRLKAVRVLRGFSRLGGEDIVPPDITGTAEWLPAVELYGEGIFLTLDEQRLQTWEQHPAVMDRLQRLLPRFVSSGRKEPNPATARFLLLHTLSHLLMRQIEFEGGYPAASLNERLYCATAPQPMAGILIHVAVPDIAGSLGGLAELAEPQRLLPLLTRALEHARWCSLDPVCSEHLGQGPGLLNRAACHACALVPEPACEYGNALLDRGFVKGDTASGMPAFF